MASRQSAVALSNWGFVFNGSAKEIRHVPFSTMHMSAGSRDWRMIAAGRRLALSARFASSSSLWTRTVVAGPPAGNGRVRSFFFVGEKPPPSLRSSGGQQVHQTRSCGAVATAGGGTALELGPSASRMLQWRTACTLVLAEHDGKTISPATLSAIEAARQLKLPVSLLVAGCDCSEAANAASRLGMVSQVCHVDNPVYKHFLADPLAELVTEMVTISASADDGKRERLAGCCEGPVKAVVGAASALGKDVLPRVAATLDVQPITDVMQISKNGREFVRPMYAGNAIAIVQSSDPLQVITVRSTSFQPTDEVARREGLAPVACFSPQSAQRHEDTPSSKWISDDAALDDKPQLGSAAVVVSGGRALKSAVNFDKLLTPLCKKLNAALGASRAAVDAGFAPNDLQVGQTGKIVAPRVYFAVGISGAIQHLAGMKDAKTIVAINKDPDAPIFQVADYGLVGDLFVILPELTEKLSQQ